MEISVSHTISMGHRLPTYQGICSSPHGHNVRVVADVAAPVFTDFKTVQDDLRDILAPMDHAMVLQDTDPLLAQLRTFGFRTVALNVEPTTEHLAQLVFDLLSAAYPRVLRVTVHETDKYSATAVRFGSRVVQVTEVRP